MTTAKLHDPETCLGGLSCPLCSEPLVATSNSNALEAMAAQRMPNMDAVHRFMVSNPQTSWEMLTEILGIGSEDAVKISGGRFRELWKLAGGSVKRNGHAWVEIDRLPAALRQIVDAVTALDTEGDANG